MNEKELEKSTKRIEAVRDANIAAIRARNLPETHPNFDGEHCVDCDDDIPDGRLKLGKIRCVSCQAFIERTMT